VTLIVTHLTLATTNHIHPYVAPTPTATQQQQREEERAVEDETRAGDSRRDEEMHDAGARNDSTSRWVFYFFPFLSFLTYYYLQDYVYTINDHPQCSRVTTHLPTTMPVV
jgi:hypothetical protein